MSRNPNRTRSQVLNCHVWAKRDHPRRRSHRDSEPGSATESLQRHTDAASGPCLTPMQFRALLSCQLSALGSRLPTLGSHSCR